MTEKEFKEKYNELVENGYFLYIIELQPTLLNLIVSVPNLIYP